VLSPVVDVAEPNTPLPSKEALEPQTPGPLPELVPDTIAFPSVVAERAKGTAMLSAASPEVAPPVSPVPAMTAVTSPIPEPESTPSTDRFPVTLALPSK